VKSNGFVYSNITIKITSKPPCPPDKATASEKAVSTNITGRFGSTQLPDLCKLGIKTATRPAKIALFHGQNRPSYYFVILYYKFKKLKLKAFYKIFQEFISIIKKLEPSFYLLQQFFQIFHNLPPPQLVINDL